MKIISHQKTNLDFINLVEQHSQKIMKEGDSAYATVEKKLQLLNELISFEFGKFLLEHKGVNGYWTEYMCSYPIRKKKSGKITSNPHEMQFLEKLPILLATQERYQIFKNEIQQRFKNGVCFASLPCGLMYDLLSIETDLVTNFKLVGIDLDANSIEQARAISLVKNLNHFCEFYHIDAWQMEFQNEFDLLASNGLNIYEKDDARVVTFYEKCFKSLKKNGVFVVSTITPSPIESTDSTWKVDKINQEDLLLQKIFFVDIIEAGFQARRSVKQTQAQLTQAGFSSFKILPDTRGMFVTFVAQKR